MLLFGYIQLAETMEPKHHLLFCDLGFCQLLASNHIFQFVLCCFKFIQSGFCGFVEDTLLDGIEHIINGGLGIFQLFFVERQAGAFPIL